MIVLLANPLAATAAMISPTAQSVSSTLSPTGPRGERPQNRGLHELGACTWLNGTYRYHGRRAFALRWMKPLAKLTYLPTRVERSVGCSMTESPSTAEPFSRGSGVGTAAS